MYLNKFFPLLILVFLFKLVSPAASGSKIFYDTPALRTSALKINVDNMKVAKDFYIGTLGFEVDPLSSDTQSVALKTGDGVKLVLFKVEKLNHSASNESQVGLTLQVNDLDKTMARLKAAGVRFDEAGVRKEAVGNAIYIFDPFGRRISLMHQTIVKDPEFKEPKIYNFGLMVPDMAAARDFYENKLGFVARSEKYLPLDMPLGHADKTFGFMLHYREGVMPANDCKCGDAPYYTIVFETNDIEFAARKISAAGIDIKSSAAKKGNTPIRFKDPFGNVLELIAGK